MIEALRDARAIVIAPSNPLISIAPILAVPAVREQLAARTATCVAVSPIVAGRALRGPAAAMLESLGHEASPAGVAAIYQGLADVLVMDAAGRGAGSACRAAGHAGGGGGHHHARRRGAGAAGARGAGCGRDRGVKLEILPLAVPGEIEAGADLAGLLLAAAPSLERGDVVVVSHKAVSKSEGRVADLREVTPSARAIELAAPDGDPRLAEMVLRESRRIVRRRGSLLIAETHHGFVCASAGIDRSNAPGVEQVVLLPVDPDASARLLRAELERRSGMPLAVVVADTMGRPLRNGIVGTAIGVSGLEPLRGYHGQADAAGYTLRTTQVAVADELAAAADLVLGKLERVPAALVRGYAAGGEGTARELIRESERDLFI